MLSLFVGTYSFLLQSPFIRYYLFFIAISLLILELSTPGFGLFGIIGGIIMGSVLLDLSHIISTSYVFMGIGILFIILELFLGFTGFLFLLGLLMIIGGYLFTLYLSFVELNLLLFISLLTLLILSSFGFYLGLRKIISLKKKKSRFFGLLNQRGVVINKNEHGYQALVDGVIWNIDCETPLNINDSILVEEEILDSLRLRVKKVEDNR